MHVPLVPVRAGRACGRAGGRGWVRVWVVTWCMYVNVNVRVGEAVVLESVCHEATCVCVSNEGQLVSM